MVPFPSRPRRGASEAPGARDPGDRLEVTPLAAPPAPGASLAPDEAAFFRAAGWQPAPADYDWFGRVDPDGLVDDPNPFGGTPGEPAPATEAP